MPRMMKIGFSSLACPTWDLPTIVDRAADYGYEGEELRGLRGELHLPLVPELAGQPDHVRELLTSKKIDLVCLGCSATLDARKPADLARNKAALTEFIELAARIGCPYVRFLAGEVQKWDNVRKCLARVAEALRSMVSIAARNRVTLLVENGGDFPGATDLWFLVDAVGHPSVQACWNQCTALTMLERATNSIPRLGSHNRMVHVCDARFDERGILQQYLPLGEGNAEVGRTIELLRGLVASPYLVFEWPKLWMDSLAGPEQVLPAAAKFLKARLAEKQLVLTAYKGDKNAPKFAQRPVTSAG